MSSFELPKGKFDEIYKMILLFHTDSEVIFLIYVSKYWSKTARPGSPGRTLKLMWQRSTTTKNPLFIVGLSFSPAAVVLSFFLPDLLVARWAEISGAS